MINTPKMRDEFDATYGPFHNTCELFQGYKSFLQDRIPLIQPENKLIALAWEMKLSRIAHRSNRSIRDQEAYRNSAGYHRADDFLGYEGKIWFRTEVQLRKVYQMQELFRGSLLSIGSGGYSTWQGPWNKYGLEISALESKLDYDILSYDDRRPLAAYAYSAHFYISDHPGLDEARIMMKLAGEGFNYNLLDRWQEDDMQDKDDAYLDLLKKICKQA